ncbi:Uncharacterised protein [uncultured archaeon]|nr:Uncharacterised protein [uncultured archaeon]
METRSAAIFILAAALAAGCLAAPAQPAAPAQQGSAIQFPKAPVAYSASYVVDEGGAQAVKRVWASGSNMRIEIADEGGGFFSLYFLGSRAYSCGKTGQGTSCFDVTGRAQAGLESFLPCQHLENAKKAGSVDVGGTEGACYYVPYGVFGKRKICCTDMGVLAYDSYNLTSGKAHVEYLSEIAYGASAADFALPAEPAMAPPEG